jgi:hypothetical protein
MVASHLLITQPVRKAQNDLSCREDSTAVQSEITARLNALVI